MPQINYLFLYVLSDANNVKNIFSDRFPRKYIILYFVYITAKYEIFRFCI